MVLFKIKLSNKSFKPFIKLTKAINMAILNVTPMAATIVCFNRARSKCSAMFNMSLKFIIWFINRFFGG